MGSTEARDEAAAGCVPDICRQTEGGRSAPGEGGVIHWSAWLMGGQKTTAVDSMAASHLQTFGEHLTSLTFI